ncbi:hypothetical protein QBC38DRAFT_444733 [Podospora fimiseda]|uniref:Uncharacterized protein n=1 Tax=Podospora fimiseda TaxID=252190 RepID=A0AAN7BMZ4_9PEZI|nr:hypothetical protein QBC38DRAFT_444733 [Podospora fimiseda]
MSTMNDSNSSFCKLLRVQELVEMIGEMLPKEDRKNMILLSKELNRRWKSIRIAGILHHIINTCEMIYGGLQREIAQGYTVPLTHYIRNVDIVMNAKYAGGYYLELDAGPKGENDEAVNAALSTLARTVPCLPHLRHFMLWFPKLTDSNIKKMSEALAGQPKWSAQYLSVGFSKPVDPRPPNLDKLYDSLVLQIIQNFDPTRLEGFNAMNQFDLEALTRRYDPSPLGHLRMDGLKRLMIVSSAPPRGSHGLPVLEVSSDIDHLFTFFQAWNGWR